MKYIDADKLKRFVGELKKEAKRNCCDSWGIVPEALETVEGFITSLQHEQPSLPSNLDEAAEKFARDDAARMWDIENKTEEEIVIAAFKAGAELMACLALTPDDIKLITKIHYELVFKDTIGVKVGDVPSEVLRRFIEMRKK